MIQHYLLGNIFREALWTCHASENDEILFGQDNEGVRSWSEKTISPLLIFL